MFKGGEGWEGAEPAASTTGIICKHEFQVQLFWMCPWSFVIPCEDPTLSCCGNKVLWLIFAQERQKYIYIMLRLP